MHKNTDFYSDYKLTRERHWIAYVQIGEIAKFYENLEAYLVEKIDELEKEHGPDATMYVRGLYAGLQAEILMVRTSFPNASWTKTKPKVCLTVQ